MGTAITSETDGRESFEELTLLVHRLHETWVAYMQLFNHSADRIAEMNRRAGFAFALIKSSMEDSVLLGIAKAVDDDCRTLSLRKAIAELPGAPTGAAKKRRKEFADERSRLLERYEDLRQLCEPILAHRHKRIAHDERSVVMGDEVLPRVTIALMQEAMNGIAQLCDQISIARTGGAGIAFIGAEMDVEPACRSLCHVLRAGNHFLEQKHDEYHQLLHRAARGEIVENLDDKLNEWRKWVTWT